MKHCLILIFIQLFVFIPVQNIKAQSIISENDSTRIFSLLQKANRLVNINRGADSAQIVCQQALMQSRNLKFTRGEAYSLLQLFTILFKRSDNRNLEYYNSNALKLGWLLKDSTIIADAYVNMGIAASYFAKQKEAIHFFEQALSTLYEKKQSAETAALYNYIGNAQMEMGKLNEQMQWQTKSLILYERLNDKKGIAQSLDNIAGLYLELGKNDESIIYAKRSLAIREKLDNYEELATGYNNLAQIYLYSDSMGLATIFGKQGLKYAELSGFRKNLAHAFTTQTVLMNRQRRNNEALQFEKKAIAILEQTGDDIMLSRRYISAAILCQSKEVSDSSGSAFYYQKALDLAKAINAKLNLRDAYFFRSKFFRINKDFERSLEDYQNHILYRDSLISDETKSSIAEIQAKYETEKKDYEIIRLNSFQKIKQLEIEKQKAIIAGNAALALQNQNEIELLSQAQALRDIQIKQQEEQLEKQFLVAKTNSQQLLLTEKENLLQHKQLKNQRLIKNLLIAGIILFLLFGITYINRYQLKKKLEQQKSLLAIRNNISQDLHDDIGASLSSINILNELARRNIDHPEKSKEYLFKASSDIQRISESLSEIVWSINPKYDDEQNLYIKMKRYAADMLDGKNIIGEFNFPTTDTGLVLTMTQRRDLYLIFKEAINNLVKYSQAKNVIISLESKKHSIELIVKDDGIGFDRNIVSQGNGLQNMEQRAQASGGQLLIQSDPASGTTLKLIVNVS